MRNRVYRSRALPVLGSPLLFILIGCGDSGQLERAYVTGKVTLDGKPVEAGRLLFRPAKGRAGRGKIENGLIVSTCTYELDDGVLLGMHQIGVQPIADVAPVLFDRMEDPTQPNKPMPKPPQAKRTKSVPIPHKYRDPSTSGLTAEIKSGENELLLELKSK